MDLNNSYSTFAGTNLEHTVQFTDENAEFVIPGENGVIPVSKNLLSKHVLLLGGIGMGKTNTFNHLVRNIKRTMTQEDVMIIFDPKGDYYEKFYQEGDVVISNDNRATDFWNIFEEVLIDDKLDENINEVATFLFKEKIKNSSNPFFPSAAKDIFSSLLTYLIKKNVNKCLNNKSLRKIVDSKGSIDYISYFSQLDELKGVCEYINKDAAGQAQGVISEYQQALRQILVGNFKHNGDFSIRKFVKNKGAKTIFIEYDLSLGKTLAPIYGLLMDLAIKQSLCKGVNEKGNVYFIMDEFRLVSALDHMDNGINFGRSLGAKFILGVQNVQQIYDVYGEYAGKSILSGCSTLISFAVNDSESRRIISERAGSSLKMITYLSKVQTKGISEQVVNANSIEDWDISRLKIGEAIVQYVNYAPFVFKFKEFK